MIEFLIITAAIVILIALQLTLAGVAIALDMAFLAPLIFATPLLLMAYVNLKDAKTLKNLSPAARTIYRIRGAGFLLVAIPLFLMNVLPYFYLYMIGLFLLNLLVCGILEHRIQK